MSNLPSPYSVTKRKPLTGWFMWALFLMAANALCVIALGDYPLLNGIGVAIGFSIALCEWLGWGPARR